VNSIKLGLLLLALLLPGISSAQGQVQRDRASNQGTPTRADSVWVNTNTDVYHCPGTRYFGNTVRGRFMSEADARAAGNRPAYGRTCGPISNATRAAPDSTPSNALLVAPSGARVWVNTSSRVYHCPGTRYYGNTKAGRYMTEEAARSGGNRPAGGRRCT
jgi:sugar lactone lactonase YvrE